MSKDSKINIDELRWVIQIRETLDEDLEDDDGEFVVSIFNVPKPLMASNPESYTPQQVAIGPYHYWRQELYEMERYKLSAAKRFQKQLQSLKLQHIVDQLIRLELRIRSCYHKYLNFNAETLAWMMAVDASFLLEFLQVYDTIQDGTKQGDYSSRKLDHNAILKDMVMLENQIPLFVLRKMLNFKFSSLKLADEMLLSMFIGLFKELSPFKVIEEDYPETTNSECTQFWFKPQVSSTEAIMFEPGRTTIGGGKSLSNKYLTQLHSEGFEACAHLLDFLYGMTVPKLEEQSDLVESSKDQNKDNEDNEKSIVNHVKQFLCKLWRLLSKLATSLTRLINKILQCRGMKVIIWLPWTIISNLPGFGMIKQPIEYLCFSREKEATKPENGNLTSDNVINNNKSPLMEEITIPSVTELSKSGVCFVATNGDISTIRFDVKTGTLHLPTIGLDMNTEVFMRNLVAYEASKSSGPLVFTRYTELMNGIIDSEDDARILREKGVILNHLKSDEEVANLWNGMSKSIKLTRVPFLDKVIEDVNMHYNGRVSIKVWKFMKLYVFASWQFLAFLAAVFLLFLMSLQVFCSFYRCSTRNRVRVAR
ncbi:putative UPF0481 protein At3g02645 [Lotus japonicus]|uniref:putative UPF0481 protein At3g02645 n=1 Tax=Lotus japonicus TaxID=34305 RepID=UPI0025859BD6|nr:putative UPF0481 protein At3g02645 [Lotus japonicus]